MITHFQRLLLAGAVLVGGYMPLGAADDLEQRFFAYEGFAYQVHSGAPTPSLNGGTGWAGAWEGDIRLVSPAYGYTDIDTTGLPVLDATGLVTSVGGVHLENASTSGNVIARRLAAPLTECWISMLVSMKGAGSIISFDHYDGNVVRPTFRLRVDGDGTWLLESADGLVSRDSNVRADVAGPRLIVVRLSDSGVELFINPRYGWQEEAPTQPHARIAKLDLGSRIVRVERLSFTTVEQLKLDELRVSTNYSFLWYQVPPPMPVVSLHVLDGVAGEPDNRASFRIMRTGLAQEPLTVQLEYGGEAIANVDYQALPVYFTIPAGMLSNWVDVTIVPVDDDVIEETETLIIRVKRDGTYQLDDAAAEISVEIDDDDQLPQVLVAAIDDTAREATWPVDYGIFRLTRTGLLDRTLTVHLRYSGSATPGSDYEPLPETITFERGENAVDLIVRPINDGLVEGNETVVIEILRDPKYRVLAPTATITIFETEQGSGAVSTSAAVSPLGEGCGAGGALALLALPLSLTIIPRRR